MKNFFKELFDMKSKEVENVTPPKDTEMEVQTKTSLADRYNNWWERENAKAFLRQYPVYGARIFPVGQTSFYEVCFGAILDKFFFSHGNGDISRKRYLTVRIQRFVYRLYAQMFMD